MGLIKNLIAKRKIKNKIEKEKLKLQLQDLKQRKKAKKLNKYDRLATDIESFQGLIDTLKDNPSVSPYVKLLENPMIQQVIMSFVAKKGINQQTPVGDIVNQLPPDVKAKALQVLQETTKK